MLLARMSSAASLSLQVGRSLRTIIGFRFMAASSSEIAEVGRFLAIRSVGHYLPITVTEPIDAPLRAMDTLADVIGAGASGGIDCRSAS